MKDKFSKIMKNQKVIIALCVFALTTITIGVSYSAFFTVKSNTNNQVVTTGNLAVTYGENQSITKTNMNTISDEQGLEQGEMSTIYIQNTGSLDSNYVLTVGYDMDSFNARSNKKDTDRLTPLEYIKIAVYEYSGSTGDTLVVGPVSLADLTVYDVNSDDSKNNRYALLFDTLDTSAERTKTYKVKMWLSDKANSYASHTYFYVKSEIIAEADETISEYNFNGILNNSENTPVGNAKISIQNGSYVTTTDESGAFTVTNLLPGTYNMDITTSTGVYSTNITVREGTEASIVSYDSNIKGDGKMNLAAAAYRYGANINALKKANNITTTSDTFLFALASNYQNVNGYIITGGLTENMGTLTFTLDNNGSVGSLTLG